VIWRNLTIGFRLVPRTQAKAGESVVVLALMLSRRQFCGAVFCRRASGIH